MTVFLGILEWIVNFDLLKFEIHQFKLLLSWIISKRLLLFCWACLGLQLDFSTVFSVFLFFQHTVLGQCFKYMMQGVSFLLLSVWCLMCLLYMVGFCPPGFREFSSMILLKILS